MLFQGIDAVSLMPRKCSWRRIRGKDSTYLTRETQSGPPPAWDIRWHIYCWIIQCDQGVV